jgi:hypothetical protein
MRGAQSGLLILEGQVRNGALDEFRQESYGKDPKDQTNFPWASISNVIRRRRYFHTSIHASSAEAGYSSQLTAMLTLNGPPVTVLPSGSTFYIKATNAKNKDNIYVVLVPIVGTFDLILNPHLAYSSQNISQAQCTGSLGNMTCVWTFTNGGSPPLYTGGWGIYLAEIYKDGGANTFGSTQIRVN